MGCTSARRGQCNERISKGEDSVAKLKRLRDLEVGFLGCNGEEEEDEKQ